MKKTILLLSIFTLSLSSWSQSITRAQLRISYVQAVSRRSALDSLLAVINKDASTLSPCEEGYLGICNALEIQYTCGMIAKYKMLDKSRAHINKAITRDPQDAELHFIRFMLEHHIPSFLGMSTHIKDDLAFIFSHPDFMDADADLKKIAMQFILESKRCNATQKASLENSLAEINRNSKKMYAEK